MKKFLNLIILIAFLFSSHSCVFAKTEKARTMLEVREFQTRYFDTTNTTQVMKAVINTLQDNGFVIQNIESDLGYITAKKDFRAKRTDKGRVALYSLEYAYYGALTGLSFGACAPYLIYPTMHMKNELSLHPVLVDSNVVVEKVGNQTKVRFVFVEKIMENADGNLFIKSAPRKVVRYYDSDIYQEFFNQVNKNLFIENI